MCGAWFMAVEAPEAPANKEFTFEIKVSLLEARPIKLLRPNQKETVSITDYTFFKYAVQEKEDFHNHLFKLNISKKKHLQVFIGKDRYPSDDKDEYTHAFGDLTEKVLGEAVEKVEMCEQFVDLVPF